MCFYLLVFVFMHGSLMTGSVRYTIRRPPLYNYDDLTFSALS